MLALSAGLKEEVGMNDIEAATQEYERLLDEHWFHTEREDAERLHGALETMKEAKMRHYTEENEAYCDALDSTYEKSGRCPFCKKRPEDIGKREGE